MKKYKIYSALIGLLLWQTACATDYIDLDTYKGLNYAETQTGLIEGVLRDNWNAFKASINETVFTENINSEQFWGAMRTSLEDGTFFNRVSNYQSGTQTGSDLFLRTAFASLTQVPVKYRSTTPSGETITLSGKIFLPQTKKAKHIIIANHYTICSNYEAPSNASSIEGVFATKDYIVLMPDYIGYGISSGTTHPYLHLGSAVTAAIDLLKAAIPYLKANSYTYYKSLILIGYSQGAAATLALQKELEVNYAHDYSIKEVYAGAGPYDLTGTFDYLTTHPKTDIPCAVPMLVMGMNYAENLKLKKEDFFQPAMLEMYPIYIESKSKLLNEVNEALGNDIHKLLRPVVFQKESFPTSVFYNALKKNNIVQWTPQSPLYLFHSTEDNMVPFLNSRNLKQALDKQELEDIEYDFDKYGTHMQAAITFFEKVYKVL